MQYLLTPEEFNNLVPYRELEKAKKALAIAREIILAESQFTCIHEKKSGYCDNCPCSSIREGYDYKDMTQLCDRIQEYSK
jgi:hypothetical protein